MKRILYVGGKIKNIPLLANTHYQVDYVQNGLIAINAVQTQDYTAVILEDQLPLMSVQHLTGELLSMDKSIPVISFIRSEERREQFLDDFGHGLFGWCEPEKCSGEELVTLLDEAQRFHDFFKELTNRDKKDFNAIGYGEIVGVSAVMIDLYQLLNQIKNKDVTVMLNGESGTGKNVIANVLHSKGIRRDKPSVSVNCPAIPSELLESELFGHEKGAFTGAIERTDGKFLMANGGTIILDEIGDMSASLQAKILRVLENGELERVGSAETMKVDIRIISATNQNLEEKIKKGEFRNDLYHRINVFPISVPTLRERKDDIPITAMFILKKLVKKHKTKSRFISTAGIRALKAYNWPGNVRELENVIERIVLLNDISVLGDNEIAPLLNENKSNQISTIDTVQTNESTPKVETDKIKDPISIQQPEPGTAVINSFILKNDGNLKTLKQLEYEAITAGLEITNWNMTHTAKQLGISRMTLYRKIDQHGLKKNG